MFETTPEIEAFIARNRMNRSRKEIARKLRQAKVRGFREVKVPVALLEELFS